jgi:hypothetical protein
MFDIYFIDHPILRNEMLSYCLYVGDEVDIDAF